MPTHRLPTILRWGGALALLAGLFLFLRNGAILAGPLLQATYTYTLTPTADSAVTMGDMADTLSFVLLNTGNDPNRPIDYVRLDLNASLYEISPATTAPVGWTVREIKNAGRGQTYVIYQANSSADGLAPGESATFQIAVTGLNGGPFAAAVADQTDVMDSATIRHQVFPPSAATFTGNLPSWKRRGLALNVVAAPPSLPVGGSILVTLIVDNRSTATQSAIAPTLSYTPTTLLTYTLGPLPAIRTLGPGASGVFTYTYQAARAGVARFTGSASNGAVTSDSVPSGDVAIGSFTALLEATPSTIVAGQEVVVRMRVYNNTGATLGNVRPSALGFLGDALVVSSSGPTPNVVASLPDGATTTFEWTYTLTGTVGSTYAFTGAASAKSPADMTTNVATSNSGAISRFSAHVTPQRVGAGTATPLALVFAVANNGGTRITRIEFTIPPGFTDASGSGRTTGSLGAPCAWTYDPGGNAFTPAAGSCGAGGLLSGGAAALTITFSAIPVPSIETHYNFHLDFCSGDRCKTGSGTGQDWQGAADVAFTITPYRVEVTADPAALPADGVSTSVITAVVYQGSAPLPGAEVVFATTGTQGTLSSYGGVTNASGVITVTFTAPVDFASSQAVIIAAYQTTQGQTTIALAGISGPNPQYIGGSLSPTSVQRGATAAFTLDVINSGNWPLTLTASSLFTFTDGTRLYTSALASPTALPVGEARALTFTSALVDPAFAVGQYLPRLRLTGWLTSPAATQVYDRGVSDRVSIALPPVSVQFSDASFRVDEGRGLAVITVTLSASTTSTVTVDYAARDGTASASSDYTAVSGRLTFAPGATSLSFTAPITDDAAFEEDETVILELSNPVNASLGAPAQAVLTIVNDDWPVYRIEARTEGALIVAVVRMEPGGPVILSWEIVE